MATGGNTTQPSIDLEKKAHDFLFSDELVKKNEALAKRFDLKEKAQDDLASAQNAVVFKEISVPEFIDTVKRIAVLNKKSSADFLDALADSFLFPLDEYFNGEPKKLLEKNKSTPSVVVRETVPRPREHTDLAKMTAIQEKTVLRAPVPRLKEARPTFGAPKVAVGQNMSTDPRASKIADAVIAEIGLGDKNLESKLREIIVARVAGSKDDLETKAMIKRSVATGGVGLEDSLAETLLLMIKTKAGIIPKVLEAPKVEVKKEIPVPLKETRQILSVDKPAGGQVKESGLPGFVAPIVSSPPPPPKMPAIAKTPSVETRPTFFDEKVAVGQVKMQTPSADLPRPSSSNETLVEQVLSAVQFPFKDDIQKTRFINAIKNRVRDIRDKFETQELLVRSENLGGVGLAEPVAVQAIAVIEKIVGEQNRRQAVAKKEELQMFDAQAKATTAQKTQTRMEQEAVEVNMRYKNLVAEKIKSVLDRPLGFLKKKEVPTVEVPETMMSKRESVKMTVPLPRPDESKLSRPKMEDIKFSPTLVGPIEELRNFTLKDWQALGAKSSVISQKLAVVRNESYTKYITALVSFRESPLFVLTQEILDESLTKNVPLSKVLEERKSANKPSLSQNEISDIMNVE